MKLREAHNPWGGSPHGARKKGKTRTAASAPDADYIVKPFRWTKDEVELLKELWKKFFDLDSGTRMERIAAVIGRSPTSIAVKASREGLNIPPRPAYEGGIVQGAERTCLTPHCGTVFWSTHFGHRHCDRCVKRASKDGYLTYDLAI